MARRISLLWWPLLAIVSPFLVPALWIRYIKFIKDISKVRQLNRKRINNINPVELPELKYFKLTVLAEEKVQPGFQGTPGICYKIETDKGALLFDIGFGSEKPGLVHNADKLNFNLDQVDALVISHLHPDHMGGFKAKRENRLILPKILGNPNGMPCFLPSPALAPGFKARVITSPQLLAAGIATTGPLARSLFLMGRTDEQALVGRLNGKGIVIITGCGHPTIQKIIEIVTHITKEPIYAVCGGFHLPVTDSPLKKPGLKVQMIWGTGKPPWKQITDEDIDKTIVELNRIDTKQILLSHHDCCRYSADRIYKELDADVSILRAGACYEL